MTRALYDALAQRDDFEVIHVPESNLLCIRWVGSIGKSQSSVDEMNRELRERYNRSGHGWITSPVLDGRRVLSVTVMNPRTSEKHVIRPIDGFVEEARRLL